MIQNNNTNDVAYLGMYAQDFIEEVSNYNFKIPYPLGNISDCWKFSEVSDIFLFDCSGTRYGFRIKELKSK